MQEYTHTHTHTQGGQVTYGLVTYEEVTRSLYYNKTTGEVGGEDTTGEAPPHPGTHHSLQQEKSKNFLPVCH